MVTAHPRLMAIANSAVDSADEAASRLASVRSCPPFYPLNPMLDCFRLFETGSLSRLHSLVITRVFPNGDLVRVISSPSHYAC